jgi:hypothetical protein
MTEKKFDFCEKCPFKSVCVSPYFEGVGDFAKKHGIDNAAVRDGIINLYEEIKSYHFDNDKPIGTKEDQECWLGKLTIALNLIGSANMSFNRLKDENKSKSGK